MNDARPGPGAESEVMPVAPADTRSETPDERDDRNLIELLQELRVAGIGVQVLFGVLLSLPFTSKFGEMNGAQQLLYEVLLVLAAVATALLLGPVAYHRLVFRRHQKRPLIEAANVMAIAGLAAVALAVTGAVLLVTSFVYHGAPAVIIAVLIGCLFAGLWFVLPLVRRGQRE
jgi:cation transport ATPase